MKKSIFILFQIHILIISGLQSQEIKVVSIQSNQFADAKNILTNAVDNEFSYGLKSENQLYEQLNIKTNEAKPIHVNNLLSKIEPKQVFTSNIFDLNQLKDNSEIGRSEYLLIRSNLILLDSSKVESPENLVQQQVEGYNEGNIDKFLAPYSEEVEFFDFPNNTTGKGKENIKPGYEALFKRFPNLHCEIINRIVLGNTVIDHEKITGIPGMENTEAIAIYKIENNKIVEVYFVE